MFVWIDSLRNISYSRLLPSDSILTIARRSVLIVCNAKVSGILYEGRVAELYATIRIFKLDDRCGIRTHARVLFSIRHSNNNNYNHMIL